LKTAQEKPITLASHIGLGPLSCKLDKSNSHYGYNLIMLAGAVQEIGAGWTKTRKLTIT